MFFWTRFDCTEVRLFPPLLHSEFHYTGGLSRTKSFRKPTGKFSIHAGAGPAHVLKTLAPFKVIVWNIVEGGDSTYIKQY